MQRIATVPADDRADLFRNTASKMQLHEAIVEKDFWVCWTLDYLFHQCQWKSSFAFKGGTSLSKSYQLIQRFSEDIDLIMDWRLLGYDYNEPWENRSNTKQDAFNKEANTRAEIFLIETVLPVLQKDFFRLLKTDVHLYIDETDKQTIRFVYPQTFSDTSILQEIRLEIGALAAWTPARETVIKPYAAEQYAKLFHTPETAILTVMAERTFWEKVTILHREANRHGSSLPSRYSRHYYDLYCMSQTAIKTNAFSDQNLLARVVQFKEKFYRCPWAKYEDAKVGTMKLMPIPEYIDELRGDYRHMENMLYGDKPTFDEILAGIASLEQELNSL
jgi:hypothetical protein